MRYKGRTPLAFRPDEMECLMELVERSGMSKVAYVRSLLIADARRKGVPLPARWQLQIDREKFNNQKGA